uniref:Reverse transcriptase domain-containing protein n=1 Tax=Cannabis sativa TaxID=3483 RepID=A0A803Q9L2_CANSA
MASLQFDSTLKLVRVNQGEAIKCYSVATKQAIFVVQHTKEGNPVGDSTKVIRFGKGIGPNKRSKIVETFKESAYIFAWTHEDMNGISPSIITHVLNIDKNMPVVKQKRHPLDPIKFEALQQELDKMLSNIFIRDVYYMEWLANPLVDATFDYEKLSFMDAYFGYNHIKMHVAVQEYTSFRTDKGVYCYLFMPFGLKNVGATYQRLVNRMFKNLLGRNMEVYLDEILVKSKTTKNHSNDLKKCFGQENDRCRSLVPFDRETGLLSADNFPEVATLFPRTFNQGLYQPSALTTLTKTRSLWRMLKWAMKLSNKNLKEDVVSGSNDALVGEANTETAKGAIATAEAPKRTQLRKITFRVLR